MFSHAFNVGFLGFVVPNLFLSPFRLHNTYRILTHYKQPVRFQEEELDFIINYDIKYRIGDELNKEEE